ncbi:conserved hypothetical protein [Pediculus humanus corporis]|uniref:J domain-containing protein n=1 Tax=Pediculus humanus subsp. corporis TaxID=121224 RepID=E0VMJ5_PEDHC|nr:uncharacterized protein Phum_PHUM310970 [Pediculus humanus corporis]EEB14601.1 conserved hypothetical protein [Pediculus humanus corporis]
MVLIDERNLWILFNNISNSKIVNVNEHLELGREFLAKGQLQDALSHYHAAVEGDPNNYLTLYKRCTVFLALGKARQAIADLDKVLQIKPDFYPARLQRGNIYFKQAKLDEALMDYQEVLRYDPNNVEAFDSYHKVYPVAEDIRMAKSQPRDFHHYEVVQVLNRVIEFCPWSAELRELRAERYSAMGNIEGAINDIKTTTKLDADNTAGYYKLALLYYSLGEAEDSLRQIRECLKLDPEHKDCFPHYKKVKKIDKLISQMNVAAVEKDYDNCIESAKKILLAESSVRAIKFRAHEKLCHCYLQNQQLPLAISSCRDALEIEKNPRIYCDRAEAYLNSELYDDAIQDYHKALELDDHYQRAKEGLQRAHKLQKQSERRDYYKILGVSRSASKKEIIKAYRKQAQKWHPDNFSDENKKKEAEKKFIDIAAAKEVLTDPEKKEKFDNGDDPLDPESGQYSQGGFKFTQGFHHFHGSPFQFKFHFT